MVLPSVAKALAVVACSGSGKQSPRLPGRRGLLGLRAKRQCSPGLGVCRRLGWLDTGVGADLADLNALIGQSEACAAEGRWEEAAAIAAAVADRARAPGFGSTRLTALAYEVWLLGAHDRREQAIAVADVLLEEFDEVAFPQQQRAIATAVEMRANALRDLGRSTEALAGYRDHARRFERSQDPEVREALPRVMNGAASLLETDEPAKALELYSRALEGFGAETSERMRHEVWRSMQHGAVLNEQLGDRENALALYRELIQGTDGEDETYATQLLAGASIATARLLLSQGRADEAFDVLANAADSLGARLLGQKVLASVLSNWGAQLSAEGRHEQALDIFDRVIRLAATSPSLRQDAFVALNNKTAILNQLGRSDDAIAAHEQLISEYGEEALGAYDDLIVQAAGSQGFAADCSLAGALMAKAALLSELGEERQAVELITQLIDRFDTADRDPLTTQVTLARQARDELLADLDEDEP